MDWRPIAEAEREGSEVLAGHMNPQGRVPYPLTSRFLDGRWTAKFARGWGSYEPQPTHYLPPPPEE